ncbi:MAG: aminotransferase class III-fold pyridoxal phosphate-dependent enzyme [Acidimicrobiia bacterium]|nr:aminotransferase class III-fold pyridoxal phosphate-dependent enzyme [Acidimicrobiia bacterium]
MTVTAKAPTFDAADSARRHLVPNFTRGQAWRSGDLGVMQRGEGCYVYDTAGTEYLDGLAGLFCTNLGHGRADLVRAAAEQMAKLAYYPTWGWANEPAALAATMIAQVAPGDLSEIFFVSSGSEAVESMLKFVRSYHLSRGEDSRYKVISREWSYHGTTLGALSVTGVPRFKEPFAPMLWEGTRKVRNTYGDTAAELASARAVEDMILAEGPETVAAVVCEPVQNGRGGLVPPDGYWQELRRICDRHGVLLVADEVIGGFGRFGHWFTSERFDVVPDVITFAKGVTSAYQPLGGMVVRGELVESVWDSPMGAYLHGATFGGHPVATAVAVATMRAMDEERVLDHVRAHESGFRRRMDQLADAHPIVGEVRGLGYFYALELVADRSTGRTLSEEQHAALRGGLLARWLRDHRVLIRPDDRGATMLTVSPPLVADNQVLDDLADRLDRTLTTAEAWLAANR